VSFTTAETAEAMEIMARLQARYPGRLQAMAGPQAKIQMHAEMEHARTYSGYFYRIFMPS
jgi:hypothetical protein